MHKLLYSTLWASYPYYKLIHAFYIRGNLSYLPTMDAVQFSRSTTELLLLGF